MSWYDTDSNGNVWRFTVQLDGTFINENLGPVALPPLTPPTGLGFFGPRGAITRTQIYNSVIALLKSATGITNGSRKAVSWDSLMEVQCPAIILDEPVEEYVPIDGEEGLTAKVWLNSFAYLILSKSEVIQPFGAETYVPMDDLDNMLDAVDSVFVADWQTGHFTMQGRVYMCFISGPVVKGNSGDSGKLIAEIPLKILVTR